MNEPDPAEPDTAWVPTHTRLIAIKELLPRWLRIRLDPYNAAADGFIERAAAETPPGALVLDAGAGECRHREFFAHASYLGTDTGMGGGTQAWDYSQLSFFSDLVALPVRDGTADAVLSVNVLEHVREPAAVLRECARILRPGGKLYLVAPQSWQLHQAPADYHRFTRYGLLVLLEGDFDVEEVTPMGGTFWNFGMRSLYLLTHFRGWTLPIGILAAPILGFLVPLACFYLDRFDRGKNDTLGHRVVARRR